MGGSTETEVIDIVENIFENNDIVVDEPGDNLYFEPEFDAPDLDVSYETVEMELEMPSMEMEEIEVVAIETEMEMEMELEMPEPKTQPEVEEVKDEPIEEVNEEPKEDVANEPEAKDSAPEADADEDKSEDMEEPKDKGETDKSKDNEKPVKKQEQKEKAAKKIVKKMGDKGRYDTTNQTKTLIVMQVLGDTKTFFDTQQQLQDRVDFFTDFMIPDTKIEDNNMAGYFLFVGSDGLMNQIEESQWQN
jgi:outer membrane biosynthesis protein TonB